MSEEEKIAYYRRQYNTIKARYSELKAQNAPASELAPLKAEANRINARVANLRRLISLREERDRVTGQNATMTRTNR